MKFLKMSKNKPIILTEINSVKEQVSQWKKQGLSVGLVPTMGALHIGHESLIKKAKETCDRVVVSIFVNPIQFGPNEDYGIYPRNLEKDSALCTDNGVDIIFSPTDEEMYPERKNLTTVIPPDFYKNKLCGLTRSGHFEGVATVVLKLFNIVQPDYAFFGQKDAQQVIILNKMAKDLNLPLKISICPIMRDENGLACSSRNTYLSPEGRKKALSLIKTLKKVEELYKNGVIQTKQVLAEAVKCLDKDAKLEYLEIYDFNSFEVLDEIKKDSLVAIAARVDNVRLIDNIIIR